jgi:hypothetical protein
MHGFSVVLRRRHVAAHVVSRKDHERCPVIRWFSAPRIQRDEFEMDLEAILEAGQPGLRQSSDPFCVSVWKGECATKVCGVDEMIP